MPPQLITTASPRDPEGVVLVLHGGAQREGRPEVSPTQLSVLRMVPVARAVAAAGRRRLAVHRLLNSARGWDTTHTPVADVAWAVEQVSQRYGDLPVGLVGHSLGGRAAILAGHLDPVRSVAALNPWVYPSDDNDLTGRSVLVVHGLDDRVAPADRAAVVARRLATRTTVGLVEIAGGRHAMLRHGRRFERYAADFTAAVLLGDGLREPAGPVAAVLGGEQRVSG